jgi:predicted DNA-binding transcriptional regulator AlpA
MKRRDLVPLKVVAEEMGMSRASLWRARQSEIPGFPEPVIIRQLVYWRKGDLEKLEAALLQYRGRIAFERNREAGRKIKAAERSRSASKKKLRRSKQDAQGPAQRNLFGD